MADQDTLTITAPADFHVHLRQGALCKSVVPQIRMGGVRTVLVMPNLVPPITTTEQALKYKETLKEIEPDVDYLMTLYLTPSLSPEEVRKAHQAGVVGVKSYPRGVTTNSDSGIEDYEIYYPIFSAMEQVGMVLNLHGEVPSAADTNTCILNAEEKFMPQLIKLNKQFPNLRIVLEHATTRAAVETVKSLGDTVGCTITVHHLALIVDDWAGQPLNFCKPVAKFPDDRNALREVIREGHPRFFLGSDSAPHPLTSKTDCTQHACAAGVYTTPVVMPLLAHLLESFGALDKLERFSCSNGRAFYQVQTRHEPIVLKRVSMPVEPHVTESGDKLVPFWSGKELSWSLESYV